MAFVTIHPRTKRQKYDGRADWSLIARARQLLSIPVVGNGDVVSVAAARQLLEETNCDAVMIGRGAVQDPLIFHRWALLHGRRGSAGAASSGSAEISVVVLMSRAVQQVTHAQSHASAGPVALAASMHCASVL